jgi:hypothetical protein
MPVSQSPKSRVSQRGELKAENARLTEALRRIQELAAVEPGPAADGLAWQALGGIKYVAATALASAV